MIINTTSNLVRSMINKRKSSDVKRQIEIDAQDMGATFLQHSVDELTINGDQMEFN